MDKNKREVLDRAPAIAARPIADLDAALREFLAALGDTQGSYDAALAALAARLARPTDGQQCADSRPAGWQRCEGCEGDCASCPFDEAKASSDSRPAGGATDKHTPRSEFLDLALACGARLTGKPNGSEAIEVQFPIPAWRKFDAATLAASVAPDETAAFDKWQDDYALKDEPNYSIDTEVDCRAAFNAGAIWASVAQPGAEPVRVPNANDPQVIAAVHAKLKAAGFTPVSAAVPDDPMDWPIPCDVKVGGVTIRKGCKLRTLVTRMESLHRMAVAALPKVTPEQRAEFDALFPAAPTTREG